MELSPSSLNRITKCGYQYYLTEVEGKEEPGKKSYNMLLGTIVGDAIQNAAIHLNQHKTLSDRDIAEHLYRAYEDHFTKAGIPPDLLAPIREVLLNGESPEVMSLLDAMSISINVSNYKFDPPAPLKGGKVSTNKKKPPFCMKTVWSLEAVLWFFEPQHPHYTLIRDAAIIQQERSFRALLQENTIMVNGVAVEDHDYVTGRFDLLLTTLEGKNHVFEFKYTNTPYTQDIVNSLTQAVTYTFPFDEVTVHLGDITEHRIFTADITSEMIALTRQKYVMAASLLRNRIFLPACGTDPYTTGKILCGFKCGGCPYAPGVDMEDAA